MSKVRKSSMVLFAAIAACAIALVGLAGCSGSADEAKSAEEVYQHYSEKAHDNFIMDGDISMGVNAQGMSMDIPMKLHLETAEGNAYTEMSTTMFGMDSVSKSYIIKEGDGYVTYSCSTTSSDDKDAWTKESSSDGLEGIEDLTKMEKSMFKDAEFAKTADGYTVNVSLSKMMTELEKAANNSGNEVQQMLDSLTSMGVDPENIKVSYMFDKEYNLVKIAIPETEIPFDVEGTSGKMNLACDITLNNHGNVKSIVVPDDILKSATEGGSLFDDTAQNLMDSASSAGAAAGSAATEATTGASNTASDAASDTSSSDNANVASSNSASSTSTDSSSDTIQKKAA